MADTSLVFNILARDKATATLNKVKTAAKIAFAAGATAAIAFGKTALDAGASLSAAMGATNQVFGASAKTMLDWSKTTADAFGIARADALAAGKDFGAFFTEIGIGAPKAATLSQEWVKMSANMAAFRDVNPTQALEAMQSALRGELDPLQQFIPAVSAASIEQQALAMSGKKSAKELTQQDKALALNAIMLKSTANKAGAAELAENGYGVQTARVTAKLKDKTAAIGQKLLPAALKLTNWALGAMEWMGKHQGLVKAIVFVLGSFAAIIGVIIGVTKIWTIVQTALNIAMMLNPVGLIIIAIIALIAIIVLIATKTRFFQTVWNAVWGAIKAAALAVGRWFAGPFAGFFVRLWNSIVSGVKSAWHWIQDTFNKVVGFVKALPKRISKAASGLWDGIKNSFKAAINWLISKWNNFSLTLGGGSVMGMKIPSVTLSTPNIPLLATGGTITQTGLAVVHRGETVTPAQAAPLGGREPLVIDLTGADEEFKRFFRAILRKNKDLMVLG